MTTLEKYLAGTALVVAVGVIATASRTGEPAEQTATADVALAADGQPVEPTEGMADVQRRRIQALRAAPRGAAAVTTVAEPDDDDAVDSNELAGIDPEAFEQVVGSLDTSRDDRLPLIAECNRRRRALRAPDASSAPLELELEVVSSGGVGRIVAVNADWPDDVDSATVDCFQRAYVGHEFATDHDYSYRYKWPVCSPTPGAGRDDGPHPEIPAPVVYQL
jgi:hypothetical protein